MNYERELSVKGAFALAGIAVLVVVGVLAGLSLALFGGSIGYQILGVGLTAWNAVNGVRLYGLRNFILYDEID